MRFGNTIRPLQAQINLPFTLCRMEEELCVARVMTASVHSGGLLPLNTSVVHLARLLLTSIRRSAIVDFANRRICSCFSCQRL